MWAMKLRDEGVGRVRLKSLDAFSELGGAKTLNYIQT